MDTVFSHIVRKRFSRVNEDIATDALTFILNSSISARSGLMKLLRAIAPGIPELRFNAQQTEGNIRPDLWGIDQTGPRVFIENKFWAGLTENQPASYLKQLAEYPQPTVLLIVAPEAREHTLWRELLSRLQNAEISSRDLNATAGTVHSIATGIGPILALTSWKKMLSILELEASDDQNTKSDFLQLRSLCEAADSDAFIPVSTSELTDQRVPRFILQLSSIVRLSVDLAVSKGILNIKGLNPQSSEERIGRYAKLSTTNSVGLWYGIHLVLWKRYGGTPLWLLFSSDDFGRATEVRKLIEPWAIQQGIFTAYQDGEFYVAIDIEAGEEMDRVVRHIADRLMKMSSVLKDL